MSPQRIQRKRTKGWRMPEGAVYVGRPSLFGNPWHPNDGAAWNVPARERRDWCIRKYEQEMGHLGLLSDYGWVAPLKADHLRACGLATMADYARQMLVGMDLVCWCPLDAPCHADVLLRIANEGCA